MMTINEFCELHAVSPACRKWALANCSSMQDCWEKLPADWLTWVATRDGVLSSKELRLFAVFCCRQIWHLLTDERSRNAVEVAERYANGEATDAELASARGAAIDAVDDATKAAMPLAVRWAMYAAISATEQLALQAAITATTHLLNTISDWSTVWNNQAVWLRENTTPCFKAK